MKKQKNLLIVVAGLLLLSCEKQDPQFVDETNASINSHENTATSKFTETDNSHDQFERSMQWISYITAETLLRDPGSRNEFLTVLQRSDEGFSVPLSKMIGKSSHTPKFKAKFTELLTFYIDPDDIRPDLGKDIPQHPVGSNNGGSQRANTAAIMAEEFMTEMTREHCLEFFIPTYPVFNQNYTTISTAHPLSNDDINDAFFLDYELNTRTGHTNTTAFIVDKVNMSSATNLLLLRPERRNDGVCDYDDLNFIDFKDFLNQ